MNKLHGLARLACVGLGISMACGGTDKGGTGPTPGINVNGVAKDRNGEPIAGATVRVSGKPSVTTEWDGGFSIPGVVVPYDIALLPPGLHTAVVYAGLTRPDPSLLYLSFQGASKTAFISGTVPPTPGTSSRSTLVVFISGPYVLNWGTADPTTGDYSFNVEWRSARDTQAGRLYLLRWTADAAGLPVSYDGYASKALIISAGNAYNGNDFVTTEVIDPPEQSISGTVAIPPGYRQTARRFFMYLDAVPIFWDQPDSLAETFTYTVPAVNGVTFGVGVQADDLASRRSWLLKTGISGNSTNVSMSLVPAPQLTLPANGAADVDAATSLTWNQGGGAGINVVVVTPANATNPAFQVVTTAAHTKIPDLAAEGMGLPAAAVYQWWVDRLFPVASVDDAADDRYLDLVGWKPPQGGETLSEAFAFTTKGAAGTAPRASVVGPSATAVQAVRQGGVMAGATGIPMNPR
jgi:hypothetical protein